MNWDAIAAIGEAVGGLAVIASLVYLATQIRQTREMQLAESVRDVFTKGSAMLAYTSSHPGTFEALRKGIVDYENLTADEKETFNCWGLTNLVTVEQAMYMHQNGLLPEVSWRAFENYGLAVTRSPGGAQWWAEHSGVIGQEIVQWLDGISDAEAKTRPTFYDLFPHWRM